MTDNQVGPTQASRTRHPDLSRRQPKWQKVERDLGCAADEAAERDLRLLAKIVKLKPGISAFDPHGKGYFDVPYAELFESEFYEEEWSPWRDRRKFRFSEITTEERAKELAASLRKRAGRDEWGIESWLQTSVEKEMTVLAVTAPRDRKPCGFVTFKRTVSVYSGPKDSSRLSYRVKVDYLYVSRDRRGRRVSSMLRKAIDLLVGDDGYRLNRALSQRTLSKFARPIEISPTLYGEVHSDEGKRFLDGLCDDITANLDLWLAEKAEVWPTTSEYGW